jgi:hypothetical protein
MTIGISVVSFIRTITLIAIAKEHDKYNYDILNHMIWWILSLLFLIFGSISFLRRCEFLILILIILTTITLILNETYYARTQEYKNKNKLHNITANISIIINSIILFLYFFPCLIIILLPNN